MAKIQELREKRTALIVSCRTMLNENPTLDAEKQAEYDQRMKDIDTLAEEITTEERLEHQAKLETELRQSAKETRTAPHRVGTSPISETRAMATWFKRQLGVQCSPQELDEAQLTGYNPHLQKLTIPLTEERTGLAEGTPGSGTTGGTLLPVNMVPALVNRWLKYFCPLRNYVRVERTLTGVPFAPPIIDFTAATVSETAEAGTIPESDPTLSKVTLNAYKTAEKILLSNELITDNVLGDGLIGLIVSGIGEVVGRSQEVKFETGSGSSTETGLVTAATSLGTQVGANITSSLSFDNVINLLYAVDAAYQTDCCFFGSNQTKNQLRLIKDSNGRYIWLPFLAPMEQNVGGPTGDYIMGHPYVTLTSIDDFSGTGAGTGGGASNPFLICCPPKQFWIRDVRELTIETNPYLYQATGQLAIFGTMRSDSNYFGPSRSITYLAN